MKILPEHRAAHQRVADVDRQDAELQGRHLGEGGRKGTRNHRELCSVLEVSDDRKPRKEASEADKDLDCLGAEED